MDEALRWTQDFSLTHGGPFFAILRSLGLARPGIRNTLRRGFAFAAVAWAPIALLEIAHWFTASDVTPLMRDPAVHVRLLLAVPLFFVAEQLLEERCGSSFRELVEGFVQRQEAVAPIAKRAARLRDSRLAEALFLALAVSSGQSVLWGLSRGSGALHGVGTHASSSTSLVWYAFVGLPLFQFLLLRSLYRWAIWSRVLIDFSRLELDLVPTHPDLAGGIGILSDPVEAFAVIALAGSEVVAATWGYRLVTDNLDPQAFASPFVLLVVLTMALAFGGLLFFGFRLWRVRLEGMRAYSEFARRYTKRFHEKWIVAPTDASPLGSSDIQSLADLGNSFEKLDHMRFVPFGPRLPILVFAATLAPMLPVLAIVKPIPELFESLGHALLGGLPR